jgi:hypothetical protein
MSRNWGSENPKFTRKLSGPAGQFKLKMAQFPCPMT